MRARAVVVLCSLIGLAITALAEPPAAQQTQKRAEVEFLPVETPSEEPAPRPWGLYDFSFNVELGHQQAVVKGNNEVYRSHLNYSDGFRVFNFNFHGKGQDGAFFSDFYVRGSGWGGDPSNWLRFGVSKEKWFDFRATYRRTDYFWVFPGFARDEHRNDQQRRLQRYDLTVLPQHRVRFRVGYSRNSSFGLALTTFQFNRDAYLLFEPIRQTHDEYRVGVEWTLHHWNFFFEQSYRFFRNDRFLFLPVTFDPGNVVGDLAFLTETQRQYPIRRRIPSTRLTVASRPHRTLDLTARILYADIDGDATRLETNVGRTVSGLNLQTTSNTRIDVDRSSTIVDGAMTWRPIPKLTLSNMFRFNEFNISGMGRTESETFFPSLGRSVLVEQNPQNLLRLESYRNRFEGRYDFTHWLGVRSGFRYEHRDVHLVRLEGEVLEDSERVGVNTRAFLLGFLLRPQRTLSVFFVLERGNNTGVFTRLSPANINRIRMRGRWEPTRGVKIAASWFTSRNSNSNLPTLLDSDGRHSSRNRGFSFDFQLVRFQRGYLNLGYSRNDITAFTNLLFFANFTLRAGDAVYRANENYAYIDFGSRLVGNLYADAGYRVVANTGTFPASDPVGTCDPLVPGVCDDRTGLDPLGINFGGLNYHQPHAALRYVFSNNVSWKANWRWYGYNVKHGTISDYKAHLITTSMMLRF